MDAVIETADGAEEVEVVLDGLYIITATAAITTIITTTTAIIAAVAFFIFIYL